MYNYKPKSNFSDRAPTLGKIFLKLFLTLLLGYGFSSLLLKYFIYPHRMTDSSMSPSIKKDEKIFLSPMVREGSLIYEKIVFANLPESTTLTFAGRIVGIPGDRIAIKSKELLRNGNFIASKTLKFTDPRIIPIAFSKRDNFEEIKLGKNEYFILCDNRDQCMDSREYGAVPLGKIKALKIGK